MKFIKILILVTSLISQITLTAAEVDKGFVVIDKEPWKISWIQEDDNTWVLLANFEKGQLKTYFKNKRPMIGLGLSSDNKPFKQEFIYHFGKKFTSKICEFEQWPDGACAYAFKYEDKIVQDGEKFVFSTTAIVQEVEGKKDEIRYALFRDF